MKKLLSIVFVVCVITASVSPVNIRGPVPNPSAFNESGVQAKGGGTWVDTSLPTLFINQLETVAVKFPDKFTQVLAQAKEADEGIAMTLIAKHFKNIIEMEPLSVDIDVKLARAIAGLIIIQEFLLIDLQNSQLIDLPSIVGVSVDILEAFDLLGEARKIELDLTIKYIERCKITFSEESISEEKLRELLIRTLKSDELSDVINTMAVSCAIIQLLKNNSDLQFRMTYASDCQSCRRDVSPCATFTTRVFLLGVGLYIFCNYCLSGHENSLI
jgi:hypothetical protein